MISRRHAVVLAVLGAAACSPPAKSGPVDAAVELDVGFGSDGSLSPAGAGLDLADPGDATPRTDAEIADAVAAVDGAPGSEMGAVVDAAAPPDAAIPEDPLMASPRCTSGIIRSPNESEGPEMSPGRMCNDCHAQANAASGEGDAPIFGFAGTIYPTGHEPDGCNASAAEGAEVVVTDATGAVFTALVNRAGNFQSDAKIVLPFQAKVVFQGRERVMTDKQAIGDCNLCHTPVGVANAKGRIVLP